MVDTYDDKLDDGYYTIKLNASYSDNITVYCHFNYTTQYAWTLIESFYLTYASYVRSYAFYENYPYNEDYVSTYRNSRYRMSSTWMQSIFESMFSRNETGQKNPRKMMSTCNFDTALDRDYLIMNLDDPNLQYNPLYNYWSTYTCLRMESINVRGYSCENEDIYAYNGGYHFFVDSDSYYCDCEPWASTAGYSEDNFGYYYYYNTDFSCSTSSSSTTNWWLGRYVPDYNYVWNSVETADSDDDDSDDDDNNKPKHTDGVVVGASIGCFVAGLILAAIFLYSYYKSKQREAEAQHARELARRSSLRQVRSNSGIGARVVFGIAGAPTPSPPSAPAIRSRNIYCWINIGKKCK